MPELQEASVFVAEGKYEEAIQLLQVHQYTQAELQDEWQKSQALLHTKHETRMSSLYEYEPDLDEKTSLVTFSQMKGATPFELLSILANNQQQH